MSQRKRMTAQSIVNIKAAKSARLLPNELGYVVRLTGSTGKEVNVKDSQGDLIYTSMANANKAISTHNPSLTADLEPEI